MHAGADSPYRIALPSADRPAVHASAARFANPFDDHDLTPLNDVPFCSPPSGIVREAVDICIPQQTERNDDEQTD